jgi:hypothetical protein
MKTTHKSHTIEFDTMFPSYPEGTLYIDNKPVLERLYAYEEPQAIEHAKQLIDAEEMDAAHTHAPGLLGDAIAAIADLACTTERITENELHRHRKSRKRKSRSPRTISTPTSLFLAQARKKPGVASLDCCTAGLTVKSALRWPSENTYNNHNTRTRQSDCSSKMGETNLS